MLLFKSTEKERELRYEPPAWARVWEHQHVALPTDSDLRHDLDAYSIKSPGSDLILFATVREDQPSESTASRVSAVLGYATASAALLYFAGHMIAAWAMGRLG